MRLFSYGSSGSDNRTLTSYDSDQGAAVTGHVNAPGYLVEKVPLSYDPVFASHFDPPYIRASPDSVSLSIKAEPSDTNAYMAYLERMAYEHQYDEYNHYATPRTVPASLNRNAMLESSNADTGCGFSTTESSHSLGRDAAVAASLDGQRLKKTDNLERKDRQISMVVQERKANHTEGNGLRSPSLVCKVEPSTIDVDLGSSGRRTGQNTDAVDNTKGAISKKKRKWNGRQRKRRREARQAHMKYVEGNNPGSAGFVDSTGALGTRGNLGFAVTETVHGPNLSKKKQTNIMHSKGVKEVQDDHFEAAIAACEDTIAHLRSMQRSRGV